MGTKLSGTMAPPLEDPIDLCDGDSDGAVAEAARSLRRQRRAAKRHRTAGAAAVAAVAQSADAIDVDSDAAGCVARNQSPQEAHRASYFQALGPMRMEFISGGGLKFHAFQSEKATAGGRKNSSKLQREYLEYALNLPVTSQASIFVRVGEARLDLVRALITGPEGTPYGHGCFFFDFHLDDYPTTAPKARFLTTGGGRVRFNPNLYNCGKVCLSLLGTWPGPGWQPNKSTLLQVLVSVQGLIMIDNPWYNEPGYEKLLGTPQGVEQSDAYNKQIQLHTLKWAIADPLRKVLDEMDGIKKGTNGRPFEYSEFSLVVAQHFVQNATVLETQLQEWTKMNDPSMKHETGVVRELLARLVRGQGVATMSAAEAQRKPAARRSGRVASSSSSS